MLCPKCGMAMACQMDFDTGNLFGLTLHCTDKRCNPNESAICIHATAHDCQIFVGNDLVNTTTLPKVRELLTLHQ